MDSSGYSDLRGLFVDSDNFEYEIGNESQLLFTNINSTNSMFIKASQKEPSKNVICKIYNPTIFMADADPLSNNKSDKAWYEQLKLLRESVFLKNLNHPTIVKFLGVNLYNNRVNFEDNDDGSTNPTLFLEFLEKRSIQANIKKNKRLIIKPVKRQIIMIGIIAAVRFLHHNGVAHRNLVPRSIWLDDNLYPRIFDFSRSRESATNDNRNATILNCDHFRYQAPEILDNQKYDMLAIDIFALGRLMYLLITSSEPFAHPLDELKKQNSFNITKKIMNDTYPYLDSSISPALQDVLLKCWSNNPNDRPSASEIYDFMKTEISNGSVLINGIQKKELGEIQAYIQMLEKFDEENLVEHPIFKTFELDLPYKDTESKDSQISRLNNFLENEDEIRDNEEEFFNLIIGMSENGSILEENYLPNVMKYVDESINNDSNSNLAKKFIENVFGECTLGYDKKEIKMGTVDKNVIVLNIPSSVKKICHYALSGYNNLVRVYIPDSVKLIEEGAFSGCTKLTYIRLPLSLEGNNLGKAAFKECLSLNYVSLPPNLTEIGCETFKKNKNLSDITLNDGLLKIDESAFSDCETLRRIKIPSTVTSIGKNAFKPCKCLDTIKFKNLKSYRIKLLKMGCKY